MLRGAWVRGFLWGLLGLRAGVEGEEGGRSRVWWWLRKADSAGTWLSVANAASIPP